MRALCRTNEPTSKKKQISTNTKQLMIICMVLCIESILILRQSHVDEAVNAIQSNDDNLFSASLYLRRVFHFLRVLLILLVMLLVCARFHFAFTNT